MTAVGRVRSARSASDGLTLRIGASYRGVRRGESVAVDGVCLTVEQQGAGWFSVHVVRTTLERTGFGEYGRGRRVNLERALKVGDRLGGHLVQGHVDGIATVVDRRREGDAWLLDLEVPTPVAAVSMPLGSITVDGVSLTINVAGPGERIQVSLIPFTFRHTTLGAKQPGDRLHVEGDTFGKYVQAMLRRPPGPPAAG